MRYNAQTRDVHNVHNVNWEKIKLKCAILYFAFLEAPRLTCKCQRSWAISSMHEYLPGQASNVKRSLQIGQISLGHSATSKIAFINP